MGKFVGVGDVLGLLEVARCDDFRVVRRFFLAFAVFGIVCGSIMCGSWIGFAQLARAQEAAVLGDPYVASREYAQQIWTATAPPVHAAGDDNAVAALRDFALRLPGGRTNAAASGKIRVAEADNAFDALREFLQKQNGNRPAAPPAKPPAPPAPKKPEVAATYVGSKACLGCHGNQVAVFNYTLMGRLQKQGKMQCETCHGPGSEHVRLGGGRGVGGIISFRSDDDSRTAEENNSICLGCHERGERVLLGRQRPRDARPRLQQLPHGHAQRVGPAPVENAVRARHLLPMPQGPPRANVPLGAHADARGQGGVRRLS